jgi:hypothetical protein
MYDINIDLSIKLLAKECESYNIVEDFVVVLLQVLLCRELSINLTYIHNKNEVK